MRAVYLAVTVAGMVASSAAFAQPVSHSPEPCVYGSLSYTAGAQICLGGQNALTCKPPDAATNYTHWVATEKEPSCAGFPR